MSTTKDKSQGPYRKGQTEGNSGQRYWSIILGTNAFTVQSIKSRPDESAAEFLSNQLNAAYKAGQADRDELVKVVRLFLKEFNDVLENTPIAYYKVERAATEVLTRITNP